MTDIQRLENDLKQLQSDLNFKLEKMHKDHMHSVNNLKQQLNTVLKAYNDKCNETDEVNKKMDRILLILEGDEKAKIKGFIDRLIILEDFKLFVNNKKTWVLGWVIGFSAAGGFLLFIKKIYTFVTELIIKP